MNVGTLAAGEAAGYTSRSYPSSERPTTECAHGVLSEPAVAFLWRDDNDLRAMWFLQARGQCVGECIVREVLALDVDGLLRSGNRIDIERLAFANRRLTVHLGDRAGNRYVHIREVRRDVNRPEILFGRCQRRQPLFTQRFPSIPGQLTKRRG